jgi:hypothetical protein
MFVNFEKKLNYTTIAAKQIGTVEDEDKILVEIKTPNF